MKIRDQITAELNYQASVEGETGNIKMCRIILESVNNVVVYNTMTKVKKAPNSDTKTDDEQYFHYVQPWVIPFIEKMHAAKDE
ncbi:hypothetical protein ABLV51_19185 [Klebsiella sp. GB_Kp051]|uniref:hypothetical protein n=1 Tax=Klebsiella TaxID=570 RepID=UPI00190EA258|nr:hypothetical protein [Klebsiella oxytoca]EIV6184129.1 hypothetical protein [Klebsiella aerogenes]MBK0678815.1 hypothetical protein [Klebsiella oxytoca]